jgi:hypothetical protein
MEKNWLGGPLRAKLHCMGGLAAGGMGSGWRGIKVTKACGGGRRVGEGGSGRGNINKLA